MICGYLARGQFCFVRAANRAWLGGAGSVGRACRATPPWFFVIRFSLYWKAELRFSGPHGNLARPACPVWPALNLIWSDLSLHSAREVFVRPGWYSWRAQSISLSSPSRKVLFRGIAKAVCAKPGRAKPGCAKPGRVRSAASGHMEPCRAALSRAEPSRAAPGKSGRVGFAGLAWLGWLG